MTHILVGEHQWETKKALVIEVQGALVRSKAGHRFTAGADDLEFIDGIQKKIWGYRLNGYVIFGISNDQTIAHGMKSEQEFQAEQQKMFLGFNRNNPFHNIGICTSDASGGVGLPYVRRSLSMLPHTGMLAEFEKNSMNFGVVIDWDRSLFVGLSKEAEQCAKNAGIPFRHISDFVSYKPENDTQAKNTEVSE